MRVVDVTELLNRDYDIRNVIFAFNDCVPTPSFHYCKKGDKPFSRLFYIKEGGHCFSPTPCDEPFLIARKGTILYIPNGCSYYSKWTESSTIAFETVHFNIFIDDEEVILCENIIDIISEHENIYTEMLTQMRKEWSNALPGFKAACKAKLYELLRYIGINKMKMSIKNRFAAIYPGIIHLENNYLHDVSVLQLANMCHVSEKTFSRLFVKYKGMSPMRFQMQMRISHASEMLKSGIYTVNEVAEIIGITDPAYFSRVFKKNTGISPSRLIPK